MSRFALAASTAVLACALPAHTAPLAAQEAVMPFPRSMDAAMMKVTPVASGELVQSWEIGTITCDGEAVAAGDWIAPHASFAAKALLDFPVTIGFAIDATGRAVDIRVLEGGYVEGKFEASFDAEKRTMRVNTRGMLESLAVRDLMPSLRASHFAEDAPRSDCRVVYTPRYTDAAEIGRDMLAAMGAGVPRLALNAARRDRLGGGDCNAQGAPAPLVAAFPDWRLIAPRPGARKWGWVRFDIDEQGLPTDVALIASTGHADLDAEALRAVRESRFAGGPRSGCTTPWWSNPATIPAPPAPGGDAFADYRSCEALRPWATRPKLTYPPAYNDRAIEGWAMLGFDIAPDGAITDVRVLAAQPSEEFGAAGVAVLTSGRFEPGEGAVTRCLERVRFVTAATAAEAEAARD